MSEHTITVSPAPASEKGALDGHKAVCSKCGFVNSTSLSAPFAAEIGREHVAYMERAGR